MPDHDDDFYSGFLRPDPRCNSKAPEIVLPPPQALGIHGFAPRIEVGKPFLMGPSKDDILEFLRGLPEDFELVSPKDKLEHEFSSKKIPSESIKFRISPIAEDSKTIGSELIEVIRDLMNIVSLDHVASIFGTVAEASNDARDILTDLYELYTNKEYQVEIDPYLSPAHRNVVNFPGKTAVTAWELADAIEAAFEQKMHKKPARSDQNPSQNKPTIYATGKNSFPPLFTDKEVRKATGASTKTDKQQSSRLSTRPRWP